MSISINSIINNEYFYPLKKIHCSKMEDLSINDILKVEAVKKTILKEKIFENKNGKSIKNILGFFCKRKLVNETLISKIKNTKFKNNYLNYLSETLQTKSIDDVVKFLYIEYFILIDLYALQVINKEECNDFLSTCLKKESVSKNSNLLVCNKQSFELSDATADSFIFGKHIKLKQEIVALYKDLEIVLIEIPQFYNLDSLCLFLKEIKVIKEYLKIDKFHFKLRFKKLKHFKKDGMYIVNDKTIIVDPRKPKAFIHELGHYIFEENLKINKIVAPNNCSLSHKSKFETYSIESENFANSLENVFID